MSEQVAKPRQPVNLDEFERRLRGPERVKSHHEDPLAELARLVDGGHDPFNGAVAPARRAPAAAPLALEPSVQMEYAHANQAHAVSPASAPGVEHASEWMQPQGVAPELQVQPQMHVDFHQNGAEVYSDAPRMHAMADGQGAEPSHDPALQDYNWQDQPMPSVEEPARRPRTGFYAMIGAVSMVVLGIGTTFALKGGPATSKDAPVIKAATGPTKVQPETAVAAAPTQAASVLDKTVDKITTSRIVNSVEQPVDTNAQRSPKAAPAREAGSSLFPEPKRVKTVSVRPDGSIIGGDIPVATTPPASVPAPPVRAQAAATPAPVRTAAAPPAATTPPVVAARPAPPKATARVAARASDDDDDVPTKPARSTKPVVDQKPAGGGFAVQLGMASSDAEAREKASRLGKQFGGNLSGRSPSIVKGEVNGQTIWRVRVVGLSHDSATAMCGKVKGSGGDCFVAR